MRSARTNSIPAPQRALLTDYLLGQLPERVAERCVSNSGRPVRSCLGAGDLGAGRRPLECAASGDPDRIEPARRAAGRPRRGVGGARRRAPGGDGGCAGRAQAPAPEAPATQAPETGRPDWLAPEPAPTGQPDWLGAGREPTAAPGSPGGAQPLSRRSRRSTPRLSGTPPRPPSGTPSRPRPGGMPPDWNHRPHNPRPKGRRPRLSPRRVFLSRSHPCLAPGGSGAPAGATRPRARGSGAPAGAARCRIRGPVPEPEPRASEAAPVARADRPEPVADGGVVPPERLLRRPVGTPLPISEPEARSQRRSSRFGGMIVLALLTIVVAVIVVLLLNSGGGGNKTKTHTTGGQTTTASTPTQTTSPTTTTSTTPASKAKVVYQVNLNPPKGGVANATGSPRSSRTARR